MNHRHALPIVLALGLCSCTGAEFKGHSASSGDSAATDSSHPDHTDGDTTRVMGSVDIGAGQHAGDVSTVNGAIHIGENAVVGHVETVNGPITVEQHVTASAVETVNGGVRIKEGSNISGGVQTINGPLNIASGADIKGELSNINGAIVVAAAHIGGQVSTVTGDIQIGPNAQLDGGLHVQRNNSWFQLGSSMPRIVIGPGSVVKGALRFDRKVLLYVSDRATIGEVEGATVNKFTGDQPPT
jgi:hypothetical protein